ncbi:MAG TPA: fumarylacetoacetate hydrolase family protein [Rhodothermales bacterium]|nr:fumarylacetoacetate hydrolase family protein [Rhodothermales bacterium]
MKLYRTQIGLIAETDGVFHALTDLDLDVIFRQQDPRHFLERVVPTARVTSEAATADLLPPIQNQEVWAAGVTYLRSKHARMDESDKAGGGDFYDRVYEAERPELFFKATGHRVAGPGGCIRIRKDAQWSVPEPELALAVSASGRIFGYTVGNDVSARDIEGENPLYLPQAKVYDRSCALGPALLIPEQPPGAATCIRLKIERDGRTVFEGATTLASMKRSPSELVSFLFRENTFPNGCFLLTGTGIVPEDSFSLQSGDVVHIKIDPIGTLKNHVA